MVEVLAPPRVLIVDDESAQVEALCDTLRDQGYEVVGHTDWHGGLQALREQSFELLLSDLMMPGMDGIELMRRALAIDPSLVAIIMTGAGTIDSAVEAMRCGALDYILKPFKLSGILPVLARALSVRRLREDNARLARQLREHAAELEAVNRDLDAFTRSASHDLRSPLNAVLGFASLLKMRCDADLSDQARGWLSQIEHAAGRMNEMIDDLLRLARLGKQALQTAPVDMLALVTEIAADIQRSQPSHQVEVRIDALPTVLGDRGLLQQVFVNLLSNAFKFTGRTPKPAIRVGHTTVDGEAAFFVQDNGAGFDMASAGRLFETFQRLHSSEDFEGTGIGLSIVRRIVERHGGRIWAVGERGQGATFYLSLTSC